jgi:S1-C subfamily serine protease
MVLTSSGYIVTNNHVVEDAVSIKVTIPGRGTYSASVVGTDVANDIAVLKVSGVSGLRTVRFASSSSAIGTAVVAIGNALGKGGTPSTSSGEIVALRQTISAENDDGSSETLEGLIESNATLEPGDSGGPLLDSAGEVIGMDTAAESTMSDDSSSYSYSIPEKEIVTVVDDILAGKASDNIIIGKTAFLGIETSDASNNGPFGLGGPGTNETTSGVVVEQVVSGSPAANAGIVAGDEITAFDSTTVTSSSQLKQLIVAERPGTQVTVTVTTTTGTTTLTLRLAAGPVA